jgi:hypothetical protein
MDRSHLIAPSILSADFARLGEGETAHLRDADQASRAAERPDTDVRAGQLSPGTV